MRVSNNFRKEKDEKTEEEIKLRLSCDTHLSIYTYTRRCAHAHVCSLSDAVHIVEGRGQLTRVASFLLTTWVGPKDQIQVRLTNQCLCLLRHLTKRL